MTLSASISVELFDVARLPAEGDNVAVAVRRIDTGTGIRFGDDGVRRVAHTILLGHRLAARAIARGEELLSWGLPFGRALRAIQPGEYVVNALTLASLAQRHLPGVKLPSEPNFEEAQLDFAFDPAQLSEATQVARATTTRTFRGYRRPGNRGVGTRNTIVVLGTSSRTGALARNLAARLQDLAAQTAGLDGIAAVAHTEGGGPDEPNNRTEVLRALAGYCVHPNVGAIVALDHGDEPVTNAVLESFLRENGYAIDDVPHVFLSAGRDPAAALRQGEQHIRAWLPHVAHLERSDAPLSELKIAVQCGGSDAFSGISANPLAGQVAREIIRHGGGVNQAETDELIGAESYFLRLVRDEDVARRFLHAVNRFKGRLAWHGVTAEGNPSGGNRLRGLYNIILKSLGAAVKKAPDVRLDWVIDYGEPIPGPGFTFMDSPGNDLESIGGQVASGCNLIFFTTGNGSITNFPFVPTIKFTSTTTRHKLLENEMDVNAGAYLDGTSMHELTAACFDLTIEVANGRQTKGERAGHSQVSIWRNWNQTRPDSWQEIAGRAPPSGMPLAVHRPEAPPVFEPVMLWPTPEGSFACDRVGLIMPASLCATQIARLAAERLNATDLPGRLGLSRFVALVHSEGCGFSSDRMYRQLGRTYVGYAAHPCAALTLFLEHGCEKVPNDVIRQHLVQAGLSPARYGWASVQLDGGIEKVLARIEAWFEEKSKDALPPRETIAGASALALGLLTTAPANQATAATLSNVIQGLIAAGATVFLSARDPLLTNSHFCAAVMAHDRPEPTLEWGQLPAAPGLHVVATESSHWSENLAGLGACGAQMFLGVSEGTVRSGHPMLPMVQVVAAENGTAPAPGTFDAILTGDVPEDVERLKALLVATASRTHKTAGRGFGYEDFQITRGLLGVST